jgi:O-acetyl-ADP-ribose deacetylase (regulator of RNase III)
LIESAAGDILKADADALVNPVNCEGETGRGLALQFKKRFPANFNAYYEACRNNIVELGQMFLFETKSKSKPFYIINFPIKQYWRDPVTLETIQAGLIDLAQIVQQHQIMTVAMPPIGCGQGGLHWKSVRPLLEQYLDSEERHFVIYGFSAPPMHKAPTRPPGPPLMTVGRAALVRLMALYTNSINDNHVTLPELHMLLFLLQEAGETLRLEFNKGSASPYARNLRRVLNALDGYYISGYIGGPDRPSKELQIIPSIEESVADFLEKYPATVGRIEKVLQLCDDFPPHSGLELLTTTLWIVTREQCYTLEDVIRRTYGWNRQKRQFSSEQISSAANRLAESGWIRPLAPEAPYTSEYNAEPPWANDPISNTKQF